MPAPAPAGVLIHHSDRGSQFASLAFGRTLRESGLVASMGSRGDAYDKRHRYHSRDGNDAL